MEIAHAQVQTHLGTNTHALTKYVGALGEILGLPGSKNVIEHLDQTINARRCIDLFFKTYTVDLIIDTVQEKIKKSQIFREKIIDWLKDQAGDWNKNEDVVQEFIEKIQLVIDQKSETMPSFTFSEPLQALITELREKQVAWPPETDSTDWIDELFALQETKVWFRSRGTNGASMRQLCEERELLKKGCSEKSLGGDLAMKLKKNIVNGEPLPLEEMKKKEIEQLKIEQIRSILPMHCETLVRVLQGQVDLKTAIENYFDLNRREEFLSALNIENIASEGVSPAILEWLLVSHNILLPQPMTMAGQLN